MKTATRPRAGPARALALPLLAILFLGTTASPALGAPDGMDETTDLTTADVGGNSCPQGDGWTKVDDIEGGSGSVTGDPDSDLGDFGTLSWDGDTVSWTLEADYMLDLCIKSGAKSGALDPTDHLGLTDTGSVTTAGPGEGGQELSHLSYRITYVPTPPPPPPADGSVTVAKVVTGDGGAPDGDFTFVIRDSDQQVLTTIDLADGTTSTPYDVPADTTLTIEETVAHNADATTWTTTGTSGTGTTTDTLTIGEDEHLTVTFTNRYDAPATQPGTDPISEVVPDPVTEVEPVVIDREEEAPPEVEVETEVEAEVHEREPEVEVLAEVLEREALPRTGADGGRLAVLGGLLLLIGTTLLRRPAPARR